MPISLMSSRLFDHAFRTGDFTGWPDWTELDDGTLCTTMMLSIQGTERNCYSVIAKTREMETARVMFLLNVEQMNERLNHLSNRFPIRAVQLMETDADGMDLGSKKRMAIQIDYGENIVLDVVDRPAMKLMDLGVTPTQANADDTEEGGPDVMDDDDSILSRFSSRSELRKARKEKEGKARGSMPGDRTKLFGFR